MGESKKKQVQGLEGSSGRSDIGRARVRIETYIVDTEDWEKEADPERME